MPRMTPSLFPTYGDHADTTSHPYRFPSGLTLFLPPLRALKAQKSKQKLKLTFEEPAKKTLISLSVQCSNVHC